MRAALAALWLIGCGSAGGVRSADVTPAVELSEVPPSTLRTLDIDRFSGTWYVAISNYRFWDPPRANTTIRYQRLAGDGVKLSDVVAYTEPSAIDGTPTATTIEGVDAQDPTLAGHFQWRGDGVLYLIVSHWYVVALDDEGQWAVTWFGDSNFGTGAGMDVYTREPCPSVAVEAEALESIFADPFLRRRASGLFRIPHDACITDARARREGSSARSPSRPRRRPRPVRR